MTFDYAKFKTRVAYLFPYKFNEHFAENGNDRHFMGVLLTNSPIEFAAYLDMAIGGLLENFKEELLEFQTFVNIYFEEVFAAQKKIYWEVKTIHFEKDVHIEDYLSLLYQNILINLTEAKSYTSTPFIPSPKRKDQIHITWGKPKNHKITEFDRGTNVYKRKFSIAFRALITNSMDTAKTYPEYKDQIDKLSKHNYSSQIFFLLTVFYKDHPEHINRFVF
jgi:hypothetical protein